MKTQSRFLIAFTITTLVAATALVGAEVPTQQGLGTSTQVDATKTPKGLSDSDWSGIRGAYERGRHAVVANPDGSHQVRNPGQAWMTRFDARGFTVTPDAGGWSWGLELAGYGEVTQVRQEGGKIFYDRGEGLTEWFVNDTRGLEQGWTLAKRPDHVNADGPIRLDLTVRGGLHPKVSDGGASVAFLNEAGSAALTYGGLKAWDADGKTVKVSFAPGETTSTAICVELDDMGARYPITIDPVAQQAILTASDGLNGDRFGSSVAVDGDTVVVGAVSKGTAYVFVRNGQSWIQQAFLRGAGYGHSVAISGDTIVVGELNGAGFAHVYVRTGDTWAHQTSLTASNEEQGDWFGWSVAVSGDTVVVGACSEDSNATGVNGNQTNNLALGSGAAYVFVRSGTSWSQQAYLKASNTGAGDTFGVSVAVSGNTVVVGATEEDSSETGVSGMQQNDNSATSSGAAYVFFRIGNTWGQQAYLKASNAEADDDFGQSVGVSGDTVVVGAPYETSNATGVNGNQTDNSASSSGAAYVFVRDGSSWTQQTYLKASNTGAGDHFGDKLAVSGDTLVVGAWGEDSNATGVNGNQTDNSASSSGAAYVFGRIGTIWNQIAYLKPEAINGGDEGYGAGFGQSVAVAGDTMVVGAYGNPVGTAVRSGAAYVFVKSCSLVASANHGTVTGTGDYIQGVTASLSVTPHPGYLFTGWTGDATGTANPLSVLMDADKTITANFTPDTNDDDDDGLTNYREIVEYGTNPTLWDTDGDGVKDSVDGRPLDPTETLDTDHDGIGDNADTDDDGDGLSDVDELTIYHTNPKHADSDGDGLSDPDELQIHLTDPNLADTDNDGLSDGAEFLTYHTNPKVGDTDGDGFLDGYEVATGKSPLDIADHPALVAEARPAIEFTFPSAVGKTYRIEGSFDLEVWTTMENGIAGNGSVIQRFYTTRDMPKRYFRVEESAP